MRLALLEADVNYKVAKDFTNKVTEDHVGHDPAGAAAGHAAGRDHDHGQPGLPVHLPDFRHWER